MKIYKIFSLLDLKHKKNKNWKISLTEVLRAIELYNAGSYKENPNSEDGYDINQ